EGYSAGGGVLGLRSYEELLGGFGQAIAFRARRQLARELVRDNAAAIVIDGASYPLYDMAMSGVSFLAQAEAPRWEVDDVLHVDIRVHATSAFRGHARVAREERIYGRRRVGLQLLGGFLDLHEMQRLDEEEALARDLVRGPEEVFSRVPQAYRDALAQAVHFAAFYQRSLAYHDARLADEDQRDARDELVRRAIEAIRPRWHELRLAAAHACLPILGDRKAMSAAKAMTETLLTPMLLAAPVLQRAYSKPLGYPGDFLVMMHIYKDSFEGATSFGKVFHKLACEEPLSAGVRTRKDLVKELTRSEYGRRRAAGEPLRVMSLGCGPAREVVELLAEEPEPPREIHWTLIDQEEKALSVAYHDVIRGIAARGAACSAQCLYLSFEQLVRDPMAIRGEPQDLIYCVGLFDYLSERRAQALVSALRERLRPGGLLAVGNARAPNDHFWLGEFVLDWSLIYRDEAALRRFALGVDPSALEVRHEPSRAYDFLLLREPA
ncbi:MAG TPA: class I SAM-dependent methyltransferase family protein, partial [Nannocystaceae bacterium]|nr:class I SAM-dependent methyltransferase family protein [Nannocystaceae bacterium]